MGTGSTDQWEVERESFAQIYDEDFDRRDVGLMLCYVSGNLAFPPDQSAAQEGGGTLFDAMSAALSKLRELPANAPEWERQIPDFVASVSRLIEGKAAQLRWAEEFDSIVRETRVTYGALLAFFEQDTEKWAAARVSSDADSDSVLKLARKLPSHLAEYLPVHERAGSFSEERDRAQSREALQPAILALLLEISGLMTAEIEERDDHRASADAAGLSYGSGSPRPDPTHQSQRARHPCHLKPQSRRSPSCLQRLSCRRPTARSGLFIPIPIPMPTARSPAPPSSQPTIWPSCIRRTLGCEMTPTHCVRRIRG